MKLRLYTYIQELYLIEIEVDAVDTGDIVNIARMVILCVLLVTFIIGIVLIAKTIRRNIENQQNNTKRHLSKRKELLLMAFSRKMLKWQSLN